MTSDKNILSIDLSKVDRELADLDKQIAALQDRRKWLIQLKEYVPTLVTNDQGLSASPENNLPEREIKSVDTTVFKRLRSVVEATTVSQFVLNRLRDHELRANEIALQYAAYLGKEFLEVRGNVFNAIFRLKEADKIEEVPEEGRTRGRKLRIKKATTQVAAF